MCIYIYKYNFLEYEKLLYSKWNKLIKNYMILCMWGIKNFYLMEVEIENCLLDIWRVIGLE